MRIRSAAVAFGTLFGFVLGWAQLDNPDVIHAMLGLEEPDVFLLMGSAILTAAAGAFALRLMGARVLFGTWEVMWQGADPTRRHIVGSAVFGLGWSLACTCPGPMAVQLGRGQVSAVFTAIGLLAGIEVQNRWTGSEATAGPCGAAEDGAVIGL